MIYPESLAPGDKIAIISPATTVKPEFVHGAVDMLRREGFNPVVMPHALGPADGSYAASAENRLSDLKTALLDPDVKCILCSRGGYGAIHLLPHLSADVVRDNPKWLIGFSDVSALHALWQKAGVASLHASMAKHLATRDADDEVTAHMLDILRGVRRMDYTAVSHPFNRPGKARGVLRGGNLAVLNSLASTPYDILTVAGVEEVILFIEDISEAIYAVERMLCRLYLAGVLHKIKGLIIGQFTEYRPDKNFNSMEEMADSLLRRCGVEGIPVAFGFPVGHVDYNLPIIEGDTVELCVTNDSVTLITI